MKFNTLLTAIAVCLSFSSYGQNTFPTPSGNVGIGTTSPSSLLQILEYSDSRPSGVNAVTKPILKLSRNGTSGYSYNESAEFRIGHGGTNVWGSQLDLFINGGNNINNIPDQHAMTWQYNGNVGIGTTSPTAKLDIFGNASNVTNLIMSANYSNAYRWRFNTIDRGGAIDLDITASNNSDQQQPILKLSPTFSGRPSLILQDNWLVAKDGNVSIGTADSKGYKFAVAGNVVAESVTVKIQSLWPDFVFANNYKLLSLNTLSKYIRLNGHLPEMPSAKEVVDNGVNLGETNKLLLKKVEELTLYLISLDKKLAMQTKRILKQDAKIKRQALKLMLQSAAISNVNKEASGLRAHGAKKHN